MRDPLDLIVSSSWGKAGELAFALEWRPQGRHFQTPTQRSGRMLDESADFAFLPTKGSTLHLILPLSQHTLNVAQYVYDMGRANLVIYK